MTKKGQGLHKKSFFTKNEKSSRTTDMNIPKKQKYNTKQVGKNGPTIALFRRKAPKTPYVELLWRKKQKSQETPFLDTTLNPL